jgi:precorrin-2 methylase
MNVKTEQYREYLAKEIMETVAAGYQAAVGMSGKAYIDMNYAIVAGDPIVYKTAWYLKGQMPNGTVSVLMDEAIDAILLVRNYEVEGVAARR